MRSIIIVLALLTCGLMLAAPPPCFALSTGNGTISFTFGTNPNLTQGGGNFGVGDYPGSYIYGPQTGGTVTNGHSTSSVSGIVNMVYNGSGPTNSFSFSAQAPSAGTTGVAEADITGYHLYGGGWYGSNISILPAFSYTYTLNGHVDSSNDAISFITQLEVAYEDPSTPNVRTKLYSDYEPSAPNFRDKMVWLKTPDQNGDLSGNGTVNFGPFDAGRDVTWFISWDFMGAAHDQLPGGGNPVPIPGAVWLLGSGLLGLVGLRRLRKS